MDDGGTWLRCAHARTKRSDGELAPRALARHYARAGDDVPARRPLADHAEESDDALWSSPASSSTASSRARGRPRPRLRRHGRGEGAPRARPRDAHLQAPRIGSRGEAESQISRTPTGRVIRASSSRKTSPGSSLQRGVRTRSRARLAAVHWDELLEAGRRVRRSPPTTRITGPTTRTSRGRGRERPTVPGRPS